VAANAQTVWTNTAYRKKIKQPAESIKTDTVVSQHNNSLPKWLQGICP